MRVDKLETALSPGLSGPTMTAFFMHNYMYGTGATTTHPHLIDIIHHSEGAGRDALQSHQVEHGRDTPLSSTLSVSVEGLQLLRLMTLDRYLY
jgi:hypothetical protein